MIEYMFSEDEAREVLDLVNERVAGIFCQPMRKVRFVFVSYIATKIRGAEVLGQCVRLSDFDEVQIRVGHGWHNTAIHELVHVYNPGVTERRVKQITNDVIKYLKVVT